jgi:hypothetical protein
MMSLRRQADMEKRLAKRRAGRVSIRVREE